MLPITRATLQSFCRVCLRELPANAASTREPNHNINEDQFFKILQSISGVTMKSSELNLYPQSICHGCFVKTNAFLKFREKAIVGTGILKLLIAESLQEAAFMKLKSYCRVCLKKGNANENFYTTEKNGEVYNYALECTGLLLSAGKNVETDSLSDDKRFPTRLCPRCYATLKNFKEFRAISQQTKVYLKGILDGADEDQDDSKHKKGTVDEIPGELMVPEFLMEAIPGCDFIKDELNLLHDNEMDDEIDYEMPIEVKINVGSETVEGVDLNDVQIKKEFDSDEELSHLTEREGDMTSTSPIDKSFVEKKITRDMKRKRKVSDSDDDENEQWDSHSLESSESDDDSDYEVEKRKTKSNKAKFLKSKININTSGNKNNETTDCNKIILNNDNNQDENSKEPYKCDECNRSFYKKYMYEAHTKAVHAGIEKPFDCKYCNSSFRLVQWLHRHVNVCHALELVSVDPDDYPYTLSASSSSGCLHHCEYCQRPFRRKDHLNEHIRAVHKGLRPFVCSICGKKFASKNTQMRHEKNHSNTRPFACEFCGKRYNSESELKVHLQRHTTSPDLLCPICKRGKANAEELQKHLEMHEASRQHQCPKCGKIFTKLFHLREHDNAVHLKLRPYKCNQCDQTFGIRKTLKTHERRHDPTERPEYCSICNLYFKTKRALMLHSRRLHPEDEEESQQI